MIRKPTRKSIPGRRIRFQIDTYCRRVDVIDGKNGWMDRTGRMDGRMDEWMEGRAFGGVAKTTEKTIPYYLYIPYHTYPTLHESPPFRSTMDKPTYFTYLLRPLRFYLSFPFTLLYLSTSSEMRKGKKKKRKGCDRLR